MNLHKEERTVPVFRQNDIYVSARLEVEVDSGGTYWLSPDQIERLTSLRDRLKQALEPALISSASTELPA